MLIRTGTNYEDYMAEVHSQISDELIFNHLHKLEHNFQPMLFDHIE